MSDTGELEGLASRLESTGQYRILRRFSPKNFYARADGAPIRLGLYVDTETTGLDPTVDEVIEVAAIPFTYSVDGRVLVVGEPFSSFSQPSRPISAEVARITGITNEMVEGRVLDIKGLETALSSASLIIAHNAAFDRPFLERLTPIAATKPWACSLSEVDWRDEGFTGSQLGYIAAEFRLFFEAHRAVVDCLVGIEILSRPLPKSGETALARLLASARTPTARIFAVHAPIETKEQLKARRYRWSPGDDGRPKAWYVDVPETELESELGWLRDSIYGYEADPIVVKLTAFERYSRR
jgi:DNA polymerase-3 subunit epsilon